MPVYSDMDCGEDAFLVTECVLGVADGVGSWRQKGVDPAIFANRLLQNAKWCGLGPCRPPPLTREAGARGRSGGRSSRSSPAAWFCAPLPTHNRGSVPPLLCLTLGCAHWCGCACTDRYVVWSECTAAVADD